MDKDKNVRTVKIELTDEDRVKARAIAKSDGLLFQFWLGDLVRKAIKKSER